MFGLDYITFGVSCNVPTDWNRLLHFWASKATKTTVSGEEFQILWLELEYVLSVLCFAESARPGRMAGCCSICVNSVGDVHRKQRLKGRP